MSSRSFGVITPHPPIFLPAVGGQRAATASTSLDALGQARHALAAYAPDLLVLMSPHAPAVADAFAVDDAASFEGDMSQFGDGRAYQANGDPEFADRLLSHLVGHDVPAIARREDSRLRSGWLDHASIVPLHFLDPRGTYRLVVLSLSYLTYESHRMLGEAVARVAEELDRRVAFIASGDLSHRLTPDAPAGYSPQGAILDEAIVQQVREGAFSRLMHLDHHVVDAGGECGLRSFVTLGGFLGDDPQPSAVLAYEGPWGVGYLTALAGTDAVEAYDWMNASAASGHKGGSAGHDDSQIVRLAREALEAWVGEHRRIDPGALSDAAYPPRAGVFVCLQHPGGLRGCIGTIAPTSPTLAEEVVRNTIEAATRDPRFDPVSPEELRSIELKVDVLHEPERATFDDLDPVHYGVIVTSGARRGLLLPDLEGVDDPSIQVAIAMQKAGIAPGEPVSLERFRVDRYT